MFLEGVLRALSGCILVSAEVDGLVESYFVVEDRFRDAEAQLPNYVVSQKAKGDKQMVLKAAFREFADRLRGMGYLAEFRWIVGRYYVTLIPRPPETRRSSRRNQLLFAATVCTIFIDGYLRSNNPVLTRSLMAGVPVYLNAIVFTVGIIVVFGVHELGHKLASERRGIRASWPFFIPAPPGMGGTFGAVISQDEPPTNRDDLFQLGIAGPFFGFVAALFVGAVGVLLSYPVPEQQVARWVLDYPEVRFELLPMPLGRQGIADAFKPTFEGVVLFFNPLAFGAWGGWAGPPALSRTAAAGHEPRRGSPPHSARRPRRPPPPAGRGDTRAGRRPWPDPPRCCPRSARR